MDVVWSTNSDNRWLRCSYFYLESSVRRFVVLVITDIRQEVEVWQAEKVKSVSLWKAESV